MTNHIHTLLTALLLAPLAALQAAERAALPNSPDAIYDLVVYGDSSGAVVAAISAKREGRSVIWVNPTGFPGGMSASGLGATDFLGRRNTFGGIASEFYDRIAAAYGTNYIRSFEPHVGKQVFEQMIADAGVTVVYREKLDRTSGRGVTMEGQRITAITTLSGKTYRGKMFIDATYVGDLMAAAGVTYTVGREPEIQYGEDMAGVRRGDTKPRVHYGQRDKDHFVKEVDPYVKPGDTNSGLLPRVFKVENLKNGQGDKKIQAYCYRLCLTTDPALRIPIEKPAGYREIDHELLLRNFDAGDGRLPALIEPLAGGRKKVDWNNMHAVGSDHPGGNWDYPEASYERRHEIEKEHETYLRGFLWTMANNPRVPEAIRKQTAAYGLPRDEFTDNGGWPWMIYIREARRMVGDYVMTQLDCEGKRTAPDPVALGSFGMDSHVVQHFVTETGHANSDGVIWRVPPKPYGISYRSIIPRNGECENLFSPICVSASHVAHGSIRMEPVFMALSQSAAIAAGVAIDQSVSVQGVPYPALREKLLAAKQIVDLSQVPAPEPKAATQKLIPSPDVLRERFLGWRFGMFIHFNMATFNNRQWATGTEDPATFAPAKLDCGQWLDAAAAAGMKYAVLTVKHTGGWCLWDSQHTAAHDIRSFRNFRNGQGDLVREFVEACRKRGIKVGFYYCLPGDFAKRHLPKGEEDNLHGLPPEAQGRYAAFIKLQLSELLTGYGPIDLLWFDQYSNRYTGDDWPQIKAHVKSLQPGCVVIANNSLDFKDTDIHSYEYPYLKAKKRPNPLPPEGNVHAAEVCDTLGLGWFWTPRENEGAMKSVEQVTSMLELCKKRRANYLLNVGPDDTGRLPDYAVKRLREIGARLTVPQSATDKP